nr:lipase 3-like [Onthophagus taurus]
MMFNIQTSLFLVYLPLIIADYNETLKDILSNTYLNTIIKKYNYPLERHWVTTEDGYIVELQRIPYSINKNTVQNRPAILFFHGNTGSAREFIVTGRKSMGLVLSDEGYDIWLANARGTSWSRRHRYLNPNYKQFWMFSFHEFGVYDLTAEINYIVNVTKQDKIFFIGHSQGGTAFCVMGSERPEMNEKIRLAILVAPNVYNTHQKNSFLRTLVDNIGLLKDIVYSIGLYEIPFNLQLGKFFSQLCVSRLKFLCSIYINTVMGFDKDQMDHELFTWEFFF